MTEGLEQGILIGMIATGIRLATPYLLAALGEMLSQRSGVFNLGLEGIMLMGAFSGFYITYVSQSPLLGLLAAIVTGGLMGLLMAFVSVTCRRNRESAASDCRCWAGACPDCSSDCMWTASSRLPD